MDELIPINQAISGAIAIIAVAGTVLLAVLARPIPPAIVAIDGASMMYFLGAQAFNVGMQHGEIVTAKKLGDGKQ